MNNISFFKAILMRELNEKDLPGNQEKIAQAAEPKDKITAADFKALRAKKGMKENETPKNKIIAQLMGPDFFLSQKPESQWDEKDYDLFDRISKMAQETGKVPKLKEAGDHEVSMAHNSLESIIKSAIELKMKLGDDEKNIPAWIQDHITNAENYINQASKNYHEYGEHDMDELPDGTEELPAGDEEDAEMSLQGLMEALAEAKKKKPSAGLTKKQKSAIAKKAASGKDIGKKGKGFEKIASKAAKKYGSKERGQAVAAAAMWKSAAKKAK